MHFNRVSNNTPSVFVSEIIYFYVDPNVCFTYLSGPFY